jgi:muramidase (phage lysozyme)
MSITIFNHLHYRKRWQHIALSALAFLLVLTLATLLGSASSVDKDLAPTIAHIGANTKPATSGKLSSEDVQYQVAIALIKTAAWEEVGFDSSRVDDAAYVDKMYRTAFTGVTFDSYMTHPFIDESVPLPCANVAGRRLCSGASGAFQFMPATWQETYEKYEWWPVSPKGEKFWPPAQDIAFLRLIAESGAYWHLEKGTKVLNNVITVDDEAIAKTFAKAANVWCSFPGDVRGECAGQPQKTLYDTIAEFQKNLAIQQGLKPSPALVGIVGSTGRSTGPHAHIQDQDGGSLDVARLNKYFRWAGQEATIDHVTSDEAAHRKRGSRGIDVGYEVGTRITGIGVKAISKIHSDPRSGNYTIISFEDGFKALVAHQITFN